MNAKDRIGATKVPLGLIPSSALAHEALAMHDGCLKYKKGNWRDEPITASIYYDACLRHLHAFIDGENYASDSGVHHLGHARACLGILLDALEHDKLIDDRPTAGPQGVIERLAPDVVRLNLLRGKVVDVTPPLSTKLPDAVTAEKLGEYRRSLPARPGWPGWPGSSPAPNSTLEHLDIQSQFSPQFSDREDLDTAFST